MRSRRLKPYGETARCNFQSANSYTPLSLTLDFASSLLDVEGDIALEAKTLIATIKTNVYSSYRETSACLDPPPLSFLASNRPWCIAKIIKNLILNAVSSPQLCASVYIAVYRSHSRRESLLVLKRSLEFKALVSQCSTSISRFVRSL